MAFIFFLLFSITSFSQELNCNVIVENESSNTQDTENLIKKYIMEKSLEKKDFGKLMGILKSNHSDEIDLSLASKIVNTLLN